MGANLAAMRAYRSAIFLSSSSLASLSSSFLRASSFFRSCSFFFSRALSLPAGGFFAAAAPLTDAPRVDLAALDLL